MDIYCGDILLREEGSGPGISVYRTTVPNGNTMKLEVRDGATGYAFVLAPDGSVLAEAPAAGPTEAWELFAPFAD